MISLRRHVRSLLVLAVVFVADTAHAQSAVNSFQELQAILQPGQSVVVTTEGGRQMKGKVLDVSASTLVLDAFDVSSLVRETRTFAPDTVTMIRRTDSIWNGALIGAGVGAVATWISVVRACSLPDPECEVIARLVFGVPMTIGGTVAGALVDRAIGNDPIYLAPSRASQAPVTVSPLFGRKGVGLSLSVRF